jgi:hypothetical protein
MLPTIANFYCQFYGGAGRGASRTLRYIHAFLDARFSMALGSRSTSVFVPSSRGRVRLHREDWADG